MSKRKRFIISSILLSLGFIGVQLLEERYRLVSIVGLGLATAVLFAWSLKETIKLNMILTTLVLPVYFTVGVGFFWFLLPSSLLTQIPVVLMYGLGIYALLLTANIYSVASIRTIALLRAARGVGFVLTLVTTFLVFDAILSIRQDILTTVLLSFVISFPLFFQGYWSTTLEMSVGKRMFLNSLVSSLVIAEVSLGIYFWPVTVVVGSLFLTTAAYLILGLGQAKLENRLFSQTVREYLTVGALVLLGMFFATRWG